MKNKSIELDMEMLDSMNVYWGEIVLVQQLYAYKNH